MDSNYKTYLSERKPLLTTVPAYYDDMGRKRLRQTVAANLTALMDRPGLKISQERLGARSGLAQRAIGRIRNGEVAATLDSVEALADAFGLQAWQLLYPGMKPDDPPQAGPTTLLAQEPGAPAYNLDPETRQRMVRLFSMFDSLTADQQEGLIRDTETMVETNLQLVRELGPKRLGRVLEHTPGEAKPGKRSK